MNRLTNNITRNSLLSVPAGSNVLVVIQDIDTIEARPKIAEGEMKFEFYDAIDFSVSEVWLKYNQIDGSIEYWILKREDVTDHSGDFLYE